MSFATKVGTYSTIILISNLGIGVLSNIMFQNQTRSDPPENLVSNFIALNSRVSVRLDLSCARFAHVRHLLTWFELVGFHT